METQRSNDVEAAKQHSTESREQIRSAPYKSQRLSLAVGETVI